eukprot:12883996-Prorocentrum_lima.AAC.1
MLGGVFLGVVGESICNASSLAIVVQTGLWLGYCLLGAVQAAQWIGQKGCSWAVWDDTWIRRCRRTSGLLNCTIP